MNSHHRPACVSVVIAEALHLASLMCATGYIFPIDDHILVVKNDGAYYRFQVPSVLRYLSVLCRDATSVLATVLMFSCSFPLKFDLQF